MTIGIDKIGFATSPYVLRLEDLAAARDTDPEKLSKGLLLKEQSVAPITEDIVTLAATAADDILTDEDKEAIEPLAFIEPANVLVVGLLTDHGLNELRPVHSRKVENNGTADHDTDVIVDSPNDVTVDEDTCYRCQGARNNRDHCLKDLKKDKERWSKDACLENKS